MEKFYLEQPSIERKEDLQNYLNELALYNSDTNGIGHLRKVFEGYSIEDAIEMCLTMQNTKDANKFPSKTFLLIREEDNKIVGAINIRWNLPPEMLQFGGQGMKEKLYSNFDGFAQNTVIIGAEQTS